MSQHKTSPRAEHRQRENLRINASPNLADRFSDLKSLSVDLAYFDVSGTRKTTEIKYTVNISHAKSVFSFSCPNEECVGGDFDLSDKLATAVTAGVDSTNGEMCCQGWQNKTTIQSMRCHNILRYKLSMQY